MASKGWENRLHPFVLRLALLACDRAQPLVSPLRENASDKKLLSISIGFIDNYTLVWTCPPGSAILPPYS
jgi:hypothetical protein